MTTAVELCRGDVGTARPHGKPRRIALLGVGQVGGAVVSLLREEPLARSFTVTSGLVRDPSRDRPGAAHIPLHSDPGRALDGKPDLVIEALGGLEPARSIVVDALRRGIPVVTANKSLLAAHGDALFEAASVHGVALRYEAAVLAGVPFLGTFAARPFARNVTGFTGIVNGTTNFILSRMAEERTPFASALADAQRRGYAEPDPHNDVHGIDAAEKLCVLLRHFGQFGVHPGDLQPEGISDVTAGDIAAASALGGEIKPVVFADWSGGALRAFAGPAFVAARQPLARVAGVQNAVVLRNRIAGDLLFAGPGAGPLPTAATLIDDAVEIARGTGSGTTASEAKPHRTRPVQPDTPWFVRISGNDLPTNEKIAELLSRYDVRVRRGLDRGDGSLWSVTDASPASAIDACLAALRAKYGCRIFRARVLEG